MHQYWEGQEEEGSTIGGGNRKNSESVYDE